MNKLIKNPFERKQRGTVVSLCILFVLFFMAFSCVKSNKGEQEFKVAYENHDISACGVNDPLQNIEWLREYCNSLDWLYYSSINIDLYKIIDKDEHIFKIYLTHLINDPVQGSTGYTSDWKDCTGKIVTRVVYPGTPMPPESIERHNEFLRSIAYVTELYHFVKR